MSALDRTAGMPTPLLALVNKVTPPSRAILYCVPTRVIRVIALDDSDLTFRVEQLVITGKDPHNPSGTWTTLSSHSDTRAGGSYAAAIEAALKAQIDLRAKLQKKMAKRMQVLKP